MKFSVLLPTRNRLDLLSYAIETVRRQDYPDWEIIISDNFSEENIVDYIEGLNDPRIKYFRTHSFIPVTDNWNQALVKCQGEYVVMLGDDDCLMQNYFSILKLIIENYDSPDLIYTGAFLYAYPGVIPGMVDGFLRSYQHREIYRKEKNPFWLESAVAIDLVESSLDFKIKFDYNMQFSLVSRKLINKMAKYGDFYQSPYPDYYASNAMMLKAERILVVPKPLVTIGISPKSFGFYYFNNAERAGNAFLKNLADPTMARRLQKVILPGTDMNTSWLLSMETLVKNLNMEMDIHVSYQRYRFLQICAVFAGIIVGKEEARISWKEMRAKLTFSERMLYVVSLNVIRFFAWVAPKRHKAQFANLVIRLAGSHPTSASENLPGNFITILDVFNRIDPMDTTH